MDTPDVARMSDPPLSLQEQLQCVTRALADRQRRYPVWVQAGEMTPAEAAYELRAMQAVVQTLAALCAQETGLLPAAEPPA